MADEPTPDAETSTRVRKPPAELSPPKALDALARVTARDVGAASDWWERHSSPEFKGLMGAEGRDGRPGSRA